MGLSKDDIRKAKETRKNSEGNQNNQIVRTGSKGVAVRKDKIERLKRELSKGGNIDEEVKVMQAKAIKIAAEVLEKRSKEKTEILFIFDKSGSCSGLESITIHGFMNVISEQLQQGYNEIVTTVLFNETEKVIHDRKPIKEVKSFNYNAFGETALYDVLGHQIMRISKAQKIEENPAEKTLVVIMTDGMDNCSHIYDSSSIRSLVNQKRTEGWEFIYLGTNLNVEIEAERLGIKASNAVEYKLNGIHNNFKAIGEALKDIHEDGEVNDDWSKPITDEDHMLPSSNGPVKRLTRGNNKYE